MFRPLELWRKAKGGGKPAATNKRDPRNEWGNVISSDLGRLASGRAYWLILFIASLRSPRNRGSVRGS